jgi:hypothetical protein
MREMTMRAPFALAALAALAAGSSTALAAEPGPDTLPINVITIQTSDADEQAEALTKALRAAVRTMPGWSLGEGDYSLEVLTLSLKCSEPPDANCQSRIADQIKSDRYVWGTLKKKGNSVVGEVHLWVRGKGTSNWPLEYSSNLTEAYDDALKRIANEALTQVTGGPPKGGVHVRAGNVSGQVFIDQQPVGALKGGEGSFMVPSGSHKVTVKAVGFADAESPVVVKPTGAPAEVNLALVPIAENASINWRRVGGIGALGLGVVAAVVGFVSVGEVAQAQSAIDLVRKGQGNAKPSSFDWCSDANTMPGAPGGNLASACSKGKTFQTMQIAFFPIAAVAGGAGIYLIATSAKSAPRTAGLSVNPQLGPGAGKLDLSYTW